MAERKPVRKATTAMMATFFPNNSSSREEFSLPFDASRLFSRGSVVGVKTVLVDFTGRVAVRKENNKINQFSS